MTPKIFFKIIGIALLLSLVAMLPFLHDIITEKGVGVKSWVPDFGIQKALTDESGKVSGYSSYRTYLYFTLLNVFATVGWLGWAKDARKGTPYKFFLLVPACLTLYTTLIILFDQRQTSFNEANTKIFLIIVLNFLLIIWFFYRYYKSRNKDHD